MSKNANIESYSTEYQYQKMMIIDFSNYAALAYFFEKGVKFYKIKVNTVSHFVSTKSHDSQFALSIQIVFSMDESYGITIN